MSIVEDILLTLIFACLCVIISLTRRMLYNLESINLKSNRTRDGQFKCYYCGGWFEKSQMETIGLYTYCPDHGHRRKTEEVPSG